MSQSQSNTDPLATILDPRSIVIAGASNNVMKMGSIQTLNLMTSGFSGEVLFIHPKDKQILGRTAYPTPSDLPCAPDLAMLVTPARVTVELMEGLGRRGVRHAVVVSAGFKEVGNEGIELEKRLLDIAREHGMRFLGPNCLGIINTRAGLNLTVFPYHDRPGKLGLISQSGTYVAQVMPYLRERGIRYSKAISVGNATDIDLVDCLDYLGRDPETGAIAMYIEGIRRGREFVECARQVARTKPIVALYVGGSGAGSRSSLSHTGSMGGPDMLYQGVFEQAGVIRASTLDELFGWTHTLASMPVPRGKRMAILTHSGGPATSMADTCEKEGLEVPELSPALQDQIRPLIEPHASSRNPIDLTFTLENGPFSREIPRLLFPSDEIDGVLVHGLMDTGIIREIHSAFKHLVSLPEEALMKAIELDLTDLIELPHKFGKPLVASNFMREDHGAETFRDHDVPLFRSPEHAVAAMAALVRYAGIRERLARSTEVTVVPRGNTEECWAGNAQTTSIPDGVSPLGAPAAVDAVDSKFLQHRDNPDDAPLPPGILDEHASKVLLSRYGVPVARECKVNTVDEAFVAVTHLAYPVVLKGLPAGVAHKTEAGLVELDIRSDSDLEHAWQRIEAIAPGCPRLIAEKLGGNRELVVGMTRFPGFGPAVMLGIGGLFTEAIRDATFRLAPLSIDEATAMPDSLRHRALLGALRGLPAVDRISLATTIRAVGKLALDHPEIAEIDINPLIVVGDKPIAADALVVVKPG